MLKKFIQHCFIVATLAVCLVCPLHAAIDYQIENQPLVIEKVVQLEQKGILKQKSNGYLYVEVSNDFISKALSLIEAPGKIVPPRHFTSKKGIGAHISVMYENEQIMNEIWEIQELGQEFTFNIIELRTIKLNKDNKAKKLWLLAVEAPELEQLRERYGLPPKLKNHDFHITLGSQIPGQPIVEELPPVEDMEEAA